MVTHGVMFHHFHGGGHPRGQGSIDEDEFRRMIIWLRKGHNILNAADYLAAAMAGTLSDSDVCLTFDDSLLCQYELAVPVLHEYGITAFFFVYSSAFTDSPDFLEVYRYFRSTAYDDFEGFAEEFINEAKRRLNPASLRQLSAFKPSEYLSEFPFYTKSDREFRYVRDQLLSSDDYSSVMKILMSRRGFDAASVIPLLYMSKRHLLDLSAHGHVVGLHSHSHPLNMALLAPSEQMTEYSMNFDLLRDLLGRPPQSMSHPMGRYSSDTLGILSHLGVKIGFLSNMNGGVSRSLLEIPREDHANILLRMAIQ